MTDPVTNVEIEDVLSSIRRLVSENARPAAMRDKAPEDKAPEAVESPEAARDEAEMLVLTPSLRVAEEAAEARDEPAAPVAPQEEARVEDPAQEEVAAEAAATEAEAEQAIADALHQVSEAESDAAEPAEQDAAEVPEAETLADRIAGLEAVVASRKDQWEPDGAGVDDYAGSPVEALNWEDSEEDLPAPDHAWEADAEEAGVSQEAGEADWIEAQAEEIVDAEAADDSAGWDEDEPTPDLFGSDDTFLDEDTLREMVAEIVRQELQGSLGERITRNVRKLVRREIHRALAAQDLE